MNGKSISGAELEKVLNSGTPPQTATILIGMAKPSESSGCIEFTATDCENWVTLPIAMIECAEHLGQIKCRDHTHSVIRITLNEPKDAEARVLRVLLAQTAPAPLRPAGDNLAPSAQDGAEDYYVPSYNAAGLSAFRRFGGFGPTLPTCHYEKRWVVCGSALPGYPVPMCYEWVQVCGWPGSRVSMM